MRHKPWEPNNFDNQERLYKAEEKVSHEKRMAEQLRKEREKEKEIERIRDLNRKNNLIVVRQTEEDDTVEEEEQKPYVPEAFQCGSLEEWLERRKEMEVEKVKNAVEEMAAERLKESGGAVEVEVEERDDLWEDSDTLGFESCSDDVCSLPEQEKYQDSSDSDSDSGSDSEVAVSAAAGGGTGGDLDSEDELDKAKSEQQLKLKEFFKSKMKVFLLLLIFRAHTAHIPYTNILPSRTSGRTWTSPARRRRNTRNTIRTARRKAKRTTERTAKRRRRAAARTS
jgi:hypothetical protein